MSDTLDELDKMYQSITEQTGLDRARVEAILNLMEPLFPINPIPDALQAAEDIGADPSNAYYATNSLLQLEIESQEKELEKIEQEIREGRIPENIPDSVKKFVEKVDRIENQTGEKHETILDVFGACIRYLKSL